MTAVPDPDAIVFRTLAAPGLDEDDVVAAMSGLSGPGGCWGDGMPQPVASPRLQDTGSERQRRHDEILKRWHPIS